MQALTTSIGLIIVLITTTLGFLQQFKDESLISITIKDTLNAQHLDNEEVLHELRDREIRSFRTTPPNKSQPDKKQQKEIRKRLSQFLNLSPLFENNIVTSQEQKEATKLLLSRLFETLYSDLDFYSRAKEQHPHLELEIIDHIASAMQEKKNSKKNSKVVASDLKKITLDDPDLNEVLYRMLSGSKSTANINSGPLVSYHSFYDFTKVSESNSSVCVWLAPSQVLLAVFQNKEVVQDIIAYRKKLHSTLDNDEKKKNEAAKEFEKIFKQHIPQDISTLEISFAISMTEPQE